MNKAELFGEKIALNFLNLKEKIDIQLQEAKAVSNKRNI